MDTITVKAGPEAVEKINDGVTAEELQRQAASSDPFDAVRMEEGILGDLNDEGPPTSINYGDALNGSKN